MQSLRETGKHIKSVAETRKITNAMYLIASTRLASTGRRLSEFRPYLTTLSRTLKAVAGAGTDRFSEKRSEGETDSPKTAFVAITSDRGLSGDYVKNVALLSAREQARIPNSDLFVVGKRGREYLESMNIPIAGEIRLSPGEPDAAKAEELRDEADRLLSAGYGRVIFSYESVKNRIQKGLVRRTYYPERPEEFLSESGSAGTEDDSEILPSRRAVYEAVLPMYRSAFLLYVLYESYLAEQSERAMAMDEANESADDYLAELTRQFNHIRQNAITEEIIEISGGRK